MWDTYLSRNQFFWETTKLQNYSIWICFPLLWLKVSSYLIMYSFFLLEKNNPTFLVLYSTVNALSSRPDSRYAFSSPKTLNNFKRKKGLTWRKSSPFWNDISWTIRGLQLTQRFYSHNRPLLQNCSLINVPKFVWCLAQFCSPFAWQCVLCYTRYSFPSWVHIK